MYIYIQYIYIYVLYGSLWPLTVPNDIIIRIITKDYISL